MLKKLLDQSLARLNLTTEQDVYILNYKSVQTALKAQIEGNIAPEKLRAAANKYVDSVAKKYRHKKMVFGYYVYEPIDDSRELSKLEKELSIFLGGKQDLPIKSTSKISLISAFQKTAIKKVPYEFQVYLRQTGRKTSPKLTFYTNADEDIKGKLAREIEKTAETYAEEPAIRETEKLEDILKGRKTPSKPTPKSVQSTKKATRIEHRYSNKINVQVIQDYASLISAINLKLASRIKANMVYPALVNRTGRFAESVRVVNSKLSQKGAPTFTYSYMRSPYDVFDRTVGALPWATPSRDPRTIIEKSLRQLIKEKVTQRFYLRRQ